MHYIWTGSGRVFNQPLLTPTPADHQMFCASEIRKRIYIQPNPPNSRTKFCKLDVLRGSCSTSIVGISLNFDGGTTCGLRAPLRFVEKQATVVAASRKPRVMYQSKEAELQMYSRDRVCRNSRIWVHTNE